MHTTPHSEATKKKIRKSMQGIQRSNLCSACRNKRTAGGFIWRYIGA